MGVSSQSTHRGVKQAKEVTSAAEAIEGLSKAESHCVVTNLPASASPVRSASFGTFPRSTESSSWEDEGREGKRQMEDKNLF